ncbi:MAG: carbohydrate kinase family protein [Clostridia bacterium]|nr:carbohydrate kinase family protein [Clostridia bacterium]
MEITVIGASILDVLARPVSSHVFISGSEPAEDIKLSFGGDACNEAVAMSRLGNAVSLISLIGNDEAGRLILDYLHKNHVDTAGIVRSDTIPTGINLVFITELGERCFVTCPKSTLRHLNEEMILSQADNMADIVSFASLFVSHDLSIAALSRIFKEIKHKPGRFLTSDCTRPKNGECLSDLASILPYLDVIFANEMEAASITGCKSPAENTALFLEAGARCAVIKTGSRGCILHSKDMIEPVTIPAYPYAKCIDTTGAGDCFAAGFLHAFSRGMSFTDCAVYANAAASCSIETVGAADGIQSPEIIQRRFEIIRSLI